MSFGANLWALDNRYQTAKDVAVANNRIEVVEYLDHCIAQQSALNTKFVQKLKASAVLEAEKRQKAAQRMMIKAAKVAKKEERKRRQRQQNSNNNLTASEGFVPTNPEVIYGESCRGSPPPPPHLTHLSHHIYETPINFVTKNKTGNSTISSAGSTSQKFSELVLSGSTVRSSSTSSSLKGTFSNKFLSAVSRKVLVKKQNWAEPNKQLEEGQKNLQDKHSSPNNDQILYGPRRYGSLSVTNLAIIETDEDDQNERGFRASSALSDDDHNSNHCQIKNDFDEIPSTIQTKSEKNLLFKKNVKSSLKGKLLKFSSKQNDNKTTNNTKDKSSSALYRTISEPDFLSAEYNSNSFKQDDHSNYQDSRLIIGQTCSSIFERPGFGSVSFRGKFTPESLFSTLGGHRRFCTDSLGNSEEDDEHDSGNSPGSSISNTISKKYTSPNSKDKNKQYRKASITDTIIKNKCPDRDSFASDSIGSAGSLVHLDEDTGASDKQTLEDCTSECSFSQKSIPVLLFLYSQGLKEYFGIFEAEKIDIEAMMLLTDKDLLSLGIPLGPRRKLLNAIHQRRSLFEETCTDNVFETKL